MNVGANVRAIRQGRGLSQAQLADMVNISQSMLCQIERGTKVPTLPLSVEIAAILGVGLDLLTADSIDATANGVFASQTAARSSG